MGFYNGLRINMSKTKSRCYLACFQGWHHIHNDKYEYMGSDCGDCISQKAYIQAVANAKLNRTTLPTITDYIS